MDDPYLSWKEPVIAQQMLNLARNFQGDDSHPPYKYFLAAMEIVNAYISFIPGVTKFVDAGCGVGHYGDLMQRHYPNIEYVGFDFSKAMVEQAQDTWPELSFLEADAKIFDYSLYDIVLASSLIEPMDNWEEATEAICETAKDIIILHRVRVYNKPTERQATTGYGKQPTWCWVHNESELANFFLDRNFDYLRFARWDEFRETSFNMMTFILRRRNG